MGVQRSAVNRAAVASLILGRIIYGVNWYSLAAVFSLTASELNQNVSGLGLATAAFFVGIGIFQVPGGVLAAKIGPRLTVICGTTIASLAALLTGFAADLVEIAILRFFVGLGMAFVFAPGVILMASFLQEGSEGLGVGLYNSAFSLGSALGLFGWAVLAAEVGWRNSLAIGGLLGIFTVILMLFLMPKDSQRSDFTVELRHLRHVLLDKWLITLSIATLGLQVGSTIYSNFMAYYLESAVRINVGEAGTIASLSSLFALVSAPFAGRLFDRYGNAKQLLLASGFLMAVGVGVAFLGTVYSAILAGVLVGVASGSGFTFCFSAAREANKLGKQYETLAVSWVNSISLSGNFVSPLLFSYFVIQYGYSPAWLYIALVAFVLIIPIQHTRRIKNSREERGASYSSRDCTRDS
jgi:MFS family permease